MDERGSNSLRSLGNFIFLEQENSIVTCFLDGCQLSVSDPLPSIDRGISNAHSPGRFSDVESSIIFGRGLCRQMIGKVCFFSPSFSLYSKLMKYIRFCSFTYFGSTSYLEFCRNAPYSVILVISLPSLIHFCPNVGWFSRSLAFALSASKSWSKDLQDGAVDQGRPTDARYLPCEILFFFRASTCSTIFLI